MTGFNRRIASGSIVAILALAACSSSSSSHTTVPPDTAVATAATSASSSGSTVPTSATTAPTVSNSASSPSASSGTPGVGDTAVWAGPVLSEVVTSAPTVIAHKGSVTCTVESAGGPGLTIPVDSGPLGGSTVAEAEAFATETGALCNDIFAAIA